MRVLIAKSAVVLLGLAVALAGLRESMSLVKFWWGLRHSLGILLKDLPFLTWLVLQSLLYLSLTAAGVALILLRPWGRVPAAALLGVYALAKLLAPPVTRADVGLGILSLVIAAVLLAGPWLGLFQGVGGR